MNISIELASFLFGVAVSVAIIAIATVFHATNMKNIKSGKIWLFERWQEQIYDTVFGHKNPEAIGRVIGLDVTKYAHNCELIRKEPNFKTVIIDKLCGFIIIAIGCIAGLLTGQIYLMLVGVIIAFPFVALPVHFVEDAATKRRQQVAEELPRFLDMLHTALLIGLPVSQSIELTAMNLRDTILADELLRSLADTKVGSYSWQQALEKLAADYEVDTLSDFVLDITNAYNLGASITESVIRKSKDIKESNLIAMKTRASKLTNLILLPILLFKLFPIIMIMALPIILQLQSSGF